MFCEKCSKYPEAHITILTESDASWFCPSCKVKALTAINTDKEIEDRCAEYMKRFEKRITALEKQQKQQTSATKQLELDLKETNLKVESLMNRPSVQSKAPDPDELYRELQQREAKKLNLIINGLPETADDIVETQKMITEVLNQTITIANATRYGKSEEDKPRVLCISMTSPHQRKEVLAKATKFRDLPEMSKYASVYIRPDLTNIQREQSKNLQAILKKTRDDTPGSKFKIKYGKIVEVVTPEPVPDER
jgi:hypothetical protein